MHSRFFLLRIIKANCKISSLTLSCIAKISSSGLFTKSFSFREKSKISSRRRGSLDQFEQNQSWVWQTASSCPNWAWRGQTRVRRAMSSRLGICTCTCKLEQVGNLYKYKFVLEGGAGWVGKQLFRGREHHLTWMHQEGTWQLLMGRKNPLARFLLKHHSRFSFQNVDLGTEGIYSYW